MLLISIRDTRAPRTCTNPIHQPFVGFQRPRPLGCREALHPVTRHPSLLAASTASPVPGRPPFNSEMTSSEQAKLADQCAEEKQPRARLKQQNNATKHEKPLTMSNEVHYAHSCCSNHTSHPAYHPPDPSIDSTLHSFIPQQQNTSLLPSVHTIRTKKAGNTVVVRFPRVHLDNDIFLHGFFWTTTLLCDANAFACSSIHEHMHQPYKTV